jgi:hypothetical protein
MLSVSNKSINPARSHITLTSCKKGIKGDSCILRKWRLRSALIGKQKQQLVISTIIKLLGFCNERHHWGTWGDK